MDDKKIDDLLNEMKDDYEKLPEFTDNRSIMNQQLKKKKTSWPKVIPVFAIVMGFLLFMLISLPYVNDFDQAENDTNYVEMYYLKAKKQFQETLGIDSVDSFQLNEQAEIILEQYGSTTDPEEIDQAKAEIDKIFTAPSQIMNQINGDSQPVSEEELDRLILNMNKLVFSLEEYFRDLLVDHKMTIDKQKMILKAQRQPENYTGSSEIRDFLITLKEQGFLVADRGMRNSLSVQVNLEWLENGIKNWEGYEGYREYLKLLGTRVDAYTPGVDNRHDIPWTDFDEILLELEKLLETYPEEREFLRKYSSIYYTMTKYLNDYLAGGIDTLTDPAGGNHLDEAAQKELKDFVKNHKQSKFNPIVKDAVNKYENHMDWVRARDIFNLDFSELSILFDERFKGISYDEIQLLRRWPISHATFEQYQDFHTEKDPVFLEKLAAFEFLSLYMYVHDNLSLYEGVQDIEKFSSLYSKESKWMEEDTQKLIEASDKEKLDFYWYETLNESTHLLKEGTEDKNNVNYIFINNLEKPARIISTIQLVKEEGSWKVLDRKVE
ncbi:hypothetical protein CIL03_09630 [Virgibacillus indicus]|uniref:Uncharacterized protein n=1 Tax=Virgibacillus indicus TaxID=2024554 RepID=A0A265NAQ7_9BACI|nr:hypothetical protein [Virgibacillus indicus]OZU88554.1 hypothetical protein CIL03_09630 [Virgibacillus indicus]